MARIDALRLASGITRGQEELPGWDKWLDDQDYYRNTDKETDDLLAAGQQPRQLYRGAFDLDGLKKTHKYGNIVHGSPHVKFAMAYKSPETIDASRDKPNHTTKADGMAVLGKYRTKPDQKYTRDFGLERGEERHTPQEIIDKEIRGGSFETDVADNEFAGHTIFRSRGSEKVDGAYAPKPQMADVNDRDFRNILRPNLKVV